MATNKLDAMLDGWDDIEDIEEEEETVGYDDSTRIEGYGVADVKLDMVKLINIPKKKVQFIEIDFTSKEGKEHRERFMIRGSDGKTFYVHQKKKKQHFGVSKIKSLIKVLGLYTGETNLMKELFSNTEDAKVEFTEYGKEVKGTYTTFPDLIGKKCKIAVRSKRENSRKANDEDDKYIQSCIKATEAFKKKHPKKKSIQKIKPTDDYVNVYQSFVNTEVAHFISTDGLLSSELGEEDGMLMDKFIAQKEAGEIFDMRTLVVEDLSEGERKKLGIDEYGKPVTDDEDESYDEGEDDAEEEEEEDDWED